MYSDKDLKDPHLLFEKRRNLMWQRIQTLNNDYKNVNHYFSKAIIETELEQLVDDFFERSFILQTNSKDESE